MNKDVAIPIFDAHFHILDPRFPLIENQGYSPPPFTLTDYRQATRSLPMQGGAVVSGSFQGYDQTYLPAVLRELGPGHVGVANIHPDTPTNLLDRLHAAGVRAHRINLKRMAGAAPDGLLTLAQRLYDTYGWPAELYVDSRRLPELSDLLEHLPAFSIDHLGLSREGLPELYRWVERGATVKASGLGRLDFDPIPALRTLYSIRPQALLFGTDLPSTRAPAPFSTRDVRRIRDHFSEAEQWDIFFDNARSWYSLNGSPATA